MSGRDRFLATSGTLMTDNGVVKVRRYLDIDEEVESIADQISMLSDLTYHEAYSLVWDAVMGVYKSHRRV